MTTFAETIHTPETLHDETKAQITDLIATLTTPSAFDTKPEAIGEMTGSTLNAVPFVPKLPRAFERYPLGSSFEDTPPGGFGKLRLGSPNEEGGIIIGSIMKSALDIDQSVDVPPITAYMVLSEHSDGSGKQCLVLFNKNTSWSLETDETSGNNPKPMVQTIDQGRGEYLLKVLTQIHDDRALQVPDVFHNEDGFILAA